MQRLYLTGNGQTGTVQTDAYSEPKEPWKCGADGKACCEDTGVKSPICLKLSELFSGFRNQVVLSVD